jgi:glutathione S-transferase
MQLFTQSLSPNGLRVAVFMKEKGIEIDTTEIDLRAAENLSDDHLSKNAFGRVPVLQLDNGEFLSESQAICKYLEGLYAEPNLFGANAEELAMIEMWSRRVELNVLIPVAQAFRNITGFFKDREKVVPEWGEVSAEIAVDSVKLFSDHLSKHTYLLGDRYCIADMTLAITLDFAKAVGQNLIVDEHLVRWHEDVKSRPAFS